MVWGMILGLEIELGFKFGFKIGIGIYKKDILFIYAGAHVATYNKEDGRTPVHVASSQVP